MRHGRKYIPRSTMMFRLRENISTAWNNLSFNSTVNYGITLSLRARARADILRPVVGTGKSARRLSARVKAQCRSRVKEEGVSARWRRNDSRDNRGRIVSRRAAQSAYGWPIASDRIAAHTVRRRVVVDLYWFDRPYANGISFFAPSRYYCLRGQFRVSHSTRDASRVINYPDVFSNRSIIKSIILCSPSSSPLCRIPPRAIPVCEEHCVTV